MIDFGEKLKKQGNSFIRWKLSFPESAGFARKHPEIFPDWDNLFQQLAEFLPIFFAEKKFHLSLRGIFSTEHLAVNQAFLDGPVKIPMDLSHGNPCSNRPQRQNSCFVTVDGNLKMCSEGQNVPIIPIGDSIITAIRKMEKLPILTDYSYSDWEQCLNCRYLRLCNCGNGFGCPGLTSVNGRKWTDPNWYHCMIMKMMEKYLLDILPQKLKEFFKLNIDHSKPYPC